MHTGSRWQECAQDGEKSEAFRGALCGSEHRDGWVDNSENGGQGGDKGKAGVIHSGQPNCGDGNGSTRTREDDETTDREDVSTCSARDMEDVCTVHIMQRKMSGG